VPPLVPLFDTEALALLFPEKEPPPVLVPVELEAAFAVPLLLALALPFDFAEAEPLPPETPAWADADPPAESEPAAALGTTILPCSKLAGAAASANAAALIVDNKTSFDRVLVIAFSYEVIPLT
jgi:hypothetical protein